MSSPASNNSVDLLRRLEPTVRPHRAAGVGDGVRPAPAFDAQSFEALLAQAFEGELQSDRPVNVADDARDAFKPPLERGQLDRLGVAADRAETAGAKRTLMMIDGRGVVLDVASRSVVAEVRSNDRDEILHVDSVMVVPDGDARADRSQTGSPFAGINDLTAARLVATPIGPKPR